MGVHLPLSVPHNSPSNIKITQNKSQQEINLSHVQLLGKWVGFSGRTFYRVYAESVTYGNKDHTQKNLINRKLLFVSKLLIDCFYLEIFTVSLCLSYYLQNWGNYADMSQGVVIYMTYTIDVLLICWFGTQLTQHVRKNTYCPSKNASNKINKKVQHNRELPTDFKSFILKCLRQRVWKTRHSGATGWVLLSHFSDVWYSSLLQLTRISIWQLESLFRCQMWPHWMYVNNFVFT